MIDFLSRSIPHTKSTEFITVPSPIPISTVPFISLRDPKEQTDARHRPSAPSFAQLAGCKIQSMGRANYGENGTRSITTEFTGKKTRKNRRGRSALPRFQRGRLHGEKVRIPGWYKSLLVPGRKAGKSGKRRNVSWQLYRPRYRTGTAT